MSEGWWPEVEEEGEEGIAVGRRQARLAADGQIGARRTQTLPRESGHLPPADLDQAMLRIIHEMPADAVEDFVAGRGDGGGRG